MKKYSFFVALFFVSSMVAMDVKNKGEIAHAWNTTKLYSVILPIIFEYLHEYAPPNSKECVELKKFTTVNNKKVKNEDDVSDIPFVTVLDDEHFASGHRDGSLRVWNFWHQHPPSVVVGATEETPGLSTGEPVSTVAALDNKTIVVGTNSGLLKQWTYSAENKSLHRSFSYDCQEPVTKVVALNDGDFVSLHDRLPHKLRLRQKNKTKAVRNFVYHGYIRDVAVLSGSKFLTAEERTRVQSDIWLWDKNNSYPCMQINTSESVCCLAALNESDFASVSDKGTIQVVHSKKSQDKKYQELMKNFAGILFSSIVAHNKRQIAVGYDALHLWDIKDTEHATQQTHATINAHPGVHITSMALFPNGLLITAAEDCIKVWGAFKKSEFERVFVGEQ